MNKLFNDKQTNTELHIAKEIINLGDAFNQMSIEEFANHARVSNSMIVKFAKNCGFSGYKELKYHVINNQKKTGVIDQNYLKYQQEKVNNFFNYISENQHLITELSDKIINSKYVVIYGHGPSLGVAKFFASRISVASKKPVIVQNDEQIMDIEIEKANPDRLVIMLSASLNTDLINNKIELMQKTGDNYVVIYENDNSNLKAINGIKLSNVEFEYDYHVFRDRSLYFMYFELVFNEICEKIHNS